VNEPPSWTDTTARATLAATPVVGGPARGTFADVRARRVAAAGKTIASIIEITGQPALEQSLERDPVVEALFVNAVDAAIRTGLEAKRRLLVQVVGDAVADEAKIDESVLLAGVLAELDVPHIRRLKALAEEWAAAQENPDEAGTFGTSQVWRATPVPIRAALVRTGTAIPETRTFDGKQWPNRQEGISDFGLQVIDRLLEEGYPTEPPAPGTE
jgi:hypothetical protein